MMKSIRSVLLYLFVFITLLFLIFSGQVYAISGQDILKNYEIKQYESKETNNAGKPIYSYVAIKLNNVKSDMINEVGGVALSDNKYAKLQISYNVEGNTYSYEMNVGYNEKGEVMLQFHEPLPAVRIRVYIEDN